MRTLQLSLELAGLIPSIAILLSMFRLSSMNVSITVGYYSCRRNKAPLHPPYLIANNLLLVTSFYLPYTHPSNDRGTTSPLTNAWVPVILSSPLLFHCCMVSSSTTLGILRHTSAYRLFRLYHKGEVLKKVREALKDGRGSKLPVEEIIMAINTLAVESGTLMPSNDGSPFQPPLASVGLVDVYGRLVYDQKHGKAIRDLIAIRGGLDKLRLPYLSSLLSG